MGTRPLVLVVEDDEDIYELFSEFLAACGYDVEGASDGVDAVARARRLRPALIVLDMVLPGLSGLEVARALRTFPETRRIPILGLTGLVRRDALDQALRAGCDVLLQKPCPLDRLEEEVRRLLEDRTAPACL
jgi:CheY-like chemotaxis protein